MTLDEQQQALYERDGYLVFPKAFSIKETAAWTARVEAMVLRPEARPAGVRLQIEPGLSPEDAELAGPLTALRKVEGLVEADPLFLDLARDPRLLGPVCSLLGPDVKLFRDALMMKPSRHGSAKPYHQDSAYWPVEPRELCSVWIALDDATRENGCMRVLPGSHRWGLLEHRHLEDFQVEEGKLDRSSEVAVPLAAGGFLLFHSMLLHATSPNRSDQGRRAMICSYMRADSRYTGPPESEPHYLLLTEPRA